MIALDKVNFTVAEGEIHGLVGENGSGKSTLVKIITGVIQPEEGAIIEIKGERVHNLNPFEAFKRGIHVVHQDLSLFPNLSIAENIVAHLYLEKKNSLINWSKVRKEAHEVLRKLDLDLDLDATVGDLRIADQQLVAICRAIASDARMLILDEPTSSLTWREVERLFHFIKSLKKQGISVIFISHRLSEVLEITDKITVLRNGVNVGTFPKKELDENKLVSLMTGKTIVSQKKMKSTENREVILKVENLTKKGQYENINFSLHKGEILGIIGPRGSGRTELATSLFGLNPPDSGKILFEGKEVKIKTNMEAVRLGIAYVPENRILQGLVLEHNIENNIAITNLDKISNKYGLIDKNLKRNLAIEALKKFKIKAQDVSLAVKTLSGGNQQKVVLAKWILTSPKILILDSPTNGIDVGAKESIHNLIKELSEKGMGIILISDEESEVLYNCSKIIVMKEGKILGEYNPENLSEKSLRRIIQQVGKNEDQENSLKQVD
ncbi:MAG: simple sugar transport system ATP-binding protein [Pseudothermotoga sp.]|nr:simple sugar transport system ATP-binding protein [Pseudothermotoga sp.]